MVSKKTWAIVGILIIVVVGAGIGYWAWTTLTPAPEEKFKIAFIVEAALEDGSWNQWGYNAMKKIEELPDIKVTYNEQVLPEDFETVVGDLVNDGNKIIFAHTLDYTEVAYAAAQKYPNTTIIISGGSLWSFLPNYGGIAINTYEGYYLVGMLGALMTETDVLGAIGGFPYPSSVADTNGFILGAQSINPNITVRSTWTNNWYDVELGKSAANAMIDQGADFIATFLSGPGIGAIDAADIAGVWATGSYVDMNYLAPNTVITSVIRDPYELVIEIIDDVQAGTFEGSNYRAGLDKNGTYLAPYHDLVSEDIANQVAAKAQAIALGDFEVPFISDHELTAP